MTCSTSFDAGFCASAEHGMAMISMAAARHLFPPKVIEFVGPQDAAKLHLSQFRESQERAVAVRARVHWVVFRDSACRWTQLWCGDPGRAVAFPAPRRLRRSRGEDRAWTSAAWLQPASGRR